ncbi:lytic transglycosylase domain-containing protein [Puniceicoccus vermicola]|uniref:Lytic transglycosylase domain-containing protein n=1 Tax=Puniceicoccus vermicola TaxID=388746 RepID=A0A7X1AX07_9BACT|nr:lytic transglycosylase domain-containing protein [Puniceicoccus vermicola]MBC2601454.1 lytic transglycosylase domain-containing protein [Puniceicoccus vermicola]
MLNRSARNFLPVLLIGTALVLSSCSRPEKKIIPAEDVWAYILKRAPEHQLDPGFVYSIAFAESSFNAYADSGVARGITQMSEDAWTTVTDISYKRAWNWRTNLNTAMLYLAHCREALVDARHFNYPLLAASYRYGPGAVKNANYTLSRLPKPTNKIYQEIFAGNIQPYAPPSADDGS